MNFRNSEKCHRNDSLGLPIGTLHAIYAILQFINRIIVTLHFFFRSKLFYFSEFWNFNFRFWMPGVDLVGVGILKNHLATTGGPGGRQAPPAWGFQVWRCGWTRLIWVVPNTIHYRRWKYCPPAASNMDTILKKPKFDLIRPKRKKTWKSSEWRHIHRFGCLKNPLLKNIIFLFLVTNEGDFGGTPVKNQ